MIDDCVDDPSAFSAPDLIACRSINSSGLIDVNGLVRCLRRPVLIWLIVLCMRGVVCVSLNFNLKMQRGMLAHLCQQILTPMYHLLAVTIEPLFVSLT